MRRDVAECSRVVSKIGSSATVTDVGLVGIAIMPERIIREDVKIGDGMMIDSDSQDDCVTKAVRTVEQELTTEEHEIVMVYDYVSGSSGSSSTPSFTLTPYSPISYESDQEEYEDPPISPYISEAVVHSPDSTFALLWEGTSPILHFAADMRADAILTVGDGTTSGIQIPYCFIYGEDGRYPQDCRF
ncbi:hypothetical protein AtEden1_Chr2g0223541 [Arabidopsis thaliana]